MDYFVKFNLWQKYMPAIDNFASYELPSIIGTFLPFFPTSDLFLLH